PSLTSGQYIAGNRIAVLSGAVKHLRFLQAEFCRRAAARIKRPAASNSPPPMRDFSFPPGDATNMRHPTTFRGNSGSGDFIRLF
ncbi:MAG TPA: hypothetical protein PLP17_16420, partial [Oligoflexia bacterium]|nr:hypothetical protein [Oligoflexia bacterium]